MKLRKEIFKKNFNKGSVVPLIFLIIVLASGSYYYYNKGSFPLSLKMIPWGKATANTSVEQSADLSGVNEINDDPENPNKVTVKSNTPQSKYTSKSGLWSISYPVTWRVDEAIGETATFSNYGDNNEKNQKPIISVNVTLSDPAIDFAAQVNKELKNMDNDPIYTYTKETLTVPGAKGTKVVYYDKDGQTKITKALYIFPLSVPNKKAYLVARVELFDSTKSTYKPGLNVADSITLNQNKAYNALQNK